MNSWRLKRNTAHIAERTLFERNFKGVLFFRLVQLSVKQQIEWRIHFMISDKTKAYYELKKRNDVRESAKSCLLYTSEIGSVLRIKQLRAEKKELLESLELYYRVFFLGEDAEESLKEGEE